MEGFVQCEKGLSSLSQGLESFKEMDVELMYVLIGKIMNMEQMYEE